MTDSLPGQAPAAASAGAVYRVRLTKVSSYLVVTQRRSATYSGTLDKLEVIARGARPYPPGGLVGHPVRVDLDAHGAGKEREGNAPAPRPRR